MNRQRRSSGWDTADAATDRFTILKLYFAGMARPHQAAGGNENSSAIGDLEQGFARLGGNGDIIGQKSNVNAHLRILKNI
jgi:hypothetical protein